MRVSSIVPAVRYSSQKNLPCQQLARRQALHTVTVYFGTSLGNLLPRNVQ